MITRCPNCLGKKTLLGLGCIIKECHGCNGVGHIKVDSAVDSIDDDVVDLAIKRRGRPKKVNDERKEA